MPDAIQQRQNRLGKAQLKQRIMARHHLSDTLTIKQNPAARLGRFARADMRQHAILIQHPLNQYFQLTAGFLAAKQARWNYPRIVEHHQVARAQIIEQISKMPITQCAARSLQAEQTTGPALSQRMTRDKFVGQIKGKITETHAGSGSGGV